jgi:hypothetical protein
LQSLTRGKYQGLAHMKRWTSWHRYRLAACPACQMQRRAPATGEAMAAGLRRTSSATLWAASTWKQSTAAAAMAMVRQSGFEGYPSNAVPITFMPVDAPLLVTACLHMCIRVPWFVSPETYAACSTLLAPGTLAGVAMLKRFCDVAGLNTLPQSCSSGRLHPGMVQRSDRETRVIIVEGINPDISEDDYSRKFQVCCAPYACHPVWEHQACM